MAGALALMAVGVGLVLVRRPWSRTLVRYTGFLVNRPLHPDAVAAWLGALGLLAAAVGAALALRGR